MNTTVAEKPTGTAVAVARPKSVTLDMADRFGMNAEAFESTVRATVFPANGTREEFAAFLLVARDYKLNPITREIYAFPKKGGGIQPIVGIDGWCNLINSQPNLDGIEFHDHLDGGKIVAITCKIFRKDRAHPTEVTEYMTECSRNTEPWKQWPARMLRHKALIQCSRYAFGFSGIQEPDEFERGEQAIVVPAQTYDPKPTRTEIAKPEPFTIVDGDGQVLEFKEAPEAVAAFAKLIADAKSRDQIDGIWESNNLPGQLRDRGHADLADACHQVADEAQKAAGATPTKEQATDAEAEPAFTPRVIPIPENEDHQPNWKAWGTAMIEHVMQAPTADAVSQIIDLNCDALAACKDGGPKSYASVDGALEKRRQQIKAKAAG